MKGKGMHQVVSSSITFTLLHYDMVKLAILAILVGQQAPVTLSPPSQHWDYRCTLLHMAFTCIDSGDLNSGQVLMCLQQALYPLSCP